MSANKRDWSSFFPLPAPRPDQIRAIDFALEELYDNGKSCIILACALGIGKSAIAATIAGYVAANPFELEDDEDFDNGTYILTSQKLLQAQYIEEFSKPPCEMKNLVSSANFDCTGRPGAKCSDSLRVYAALGDKFPKGPREHCACNCAYKKQKRDFLQALTGVTNYSYFLSETMYAGQLKPRRLLVTDECHHLSDIISKHVELKISQRFSEIVLKVKFTTERDPAKIMAWLTKKYEPALKKHIKKMIVEIEKAKDDKKILSLSEQLELMDKHICKVHRTQKTWDVNNWIVNYEKSEAFSSITFKPIEVSAWTDDMLFSYGQKRVLLSATILDNDYYMKSVGLDPKKTAILTIDSPFETKNKPIFYMPVGKMSYGDIDTTIPKMIEIVKELLSQHPTEKGLIHSGNLKVTEAIAKGINDPRLLIQERGGNRDALLEAHKKSTEPTVLVSPSMTEGVDLKDDLSRFQIFCKIPFPSLADEVIKRKVEIDKRYYPYATAQAIVQATGRSVRNENDWAVTYILDECATNFFRFSKHLFPKSFLDALMYIDGNKVIK